MRGDVHASAPFASACSLAHTSPRHHAPAPALPGGWTDYDGREPVPNHAIEDPVVGSILQSFTGDAKRQGELWGWLKSVVRDRDLARLKRDSLTLDRAPAEVTSGFLTLVLPLLQSRDDVRVRVMLREHREVRTDIKLLVEDRTRTGTDRKAAVAVWRSTG